MKPRSLFEALVQYQTKWFQQFQNPFAEQASILDQFKSLLLDSDAPFSRDQYPGHLTSSCFILNPDQSHILLLHHRKLGKWLQMGGHCDGEIETPEVALKEAEEESGSKEVRLLSSQIFDLDIHLIPARNDEPEHYHYDVRYLGLCQKPNTIQVAEREAIDLAWFSWERAFQVAKEPSMHRVFKKIEFLKGLNPEEK